MSTQQIDYSFNEAEYEENMVFPLMHLDMIVKAGKGEYKTKPADIDKRHAAVTAFIRTRQLIPESADRKLIESIRQAMESKIEAAEVGERQLINPDAPIEIECQANNTKSQRRRSRT